MGKYNVSDTSASEIDSVDTELPKLPDRPEFEHPVRAKRKLKVIYAFALLILLAIIAVLGTYGYRHYYVKSVTTAVTATITKQVVAVDPYAGWKSFCSTTGGLCIKYPADWKFNQVTYAEGQYAVGTEVNTVTSPSGNTAVTYMPAYEGPAGIGNNVTISVGSVTPTTSPDFEAVSLKSKQNGIYSDEYFVTTKSNDARTLPGNTTSFTQGSTITGSYIGTYYGFSNPRKPTTAPQRQSLAITQKGNGNIFNTVDEANAWFNSSEVLTADQILASVSYDQYLTIKEWGVRAPYSGSLNLSYTISSDYRTVTFSSGQLTTLSSDCIGRGGFIERWASTDQVSEGPPDANTPTAANAFAGKDPSTLPYAHIGNYYYTFAHDQAACGDLNTTATLQQQTNDAVKALVANLQAIPN